MTVRPIIVFALLALGLPAIVAHDGPNRVIDALTHRIEAEGATPRLLAARAYEYQSLRNWGAALADFRAALQRQADYSPAVIGCAEILLQQGQLNEARELARRGVTLGHDLLTQAPYHALQARIHAHQRDWAAALSAWRAALRSPYPEIDWFLGEAETLERLGRHADQVAALAAAMTRSPSVVLQRAWIEALVSAGELERASDEIEKELAQSRWQSHWLLLRARIAGQRGQYDAQKADASAALTEIRRRLSPEHPDPLLVTDAALALALLGERDQALAYIRKARTLGVSEITLGELAAAAGRPVE